MKKTIKVLCLDTIPVIFGVLIALFIGDWKSDQDDKKYMERMIGVMKEEAKVNFDDLNEIIPTHLRMIDTISFYTNSGKAIPLVALFKKNEGFKLPGVDNRTWTAVINNRIELVDFETLKLVNSIDGLKEVTAKKVDFIMNYVYDNMNEVTTESKETLRMHFLNLVESEIQLFIIHGQFLGQDNVQTEWMQDYGIEVAS